MANIYPCSDVHFRSPTDASDWARDEVPANADIVVIAGDIANGPKQGIKCMKRILQEHPDKIFIICLGNHDYWGGVTMASTWYQWNQLADRYPNFYFLNQVPIVVKGITFIGATLWTDMQLTDDFYAVQNVYHTSWPDYMNVEFAAHMVGFPAYEFVQQFKNHLSAIWEHASNALEQGKQVYVVTHHLPDPESLDKRYNGSDYNPFYASKGILDNFPVEGAIWQHGHTHARKDYEKNGWRVICNPRGYLMERYSCDTDDRDRLADQNLIIQLGD